MADVFKSKDFVDSNWDVEFIEFPQVAAHQMAEAVVTNGESLPNSSELTEVRATSNNPRNGLERKVYAGIINAQHVRLYGRYAKAGRRHQAEVQTLFGVAVAILTIVMFSLGLL